MCFFNTVFFYIKPFLSIICSLTHSHTHNAKKERTHERGLYKDKEEEKTRVMGGGRWGVYVGVCMLCDEDAPPSHFLCLGLILQSCPQEKGPADSVFKGVPQA